MLTEWGHLDWDAVTNGVRERANVMAQSGKIRGRSPLKTIVRVGTLDQTTVLLQNVISIKEKELVVAMCQNARGSEIWDYLFSRTALHNGKFLS